MDDLQGEPQGWGQQCGARGEPVGGEALGLGWVGAQQRGVGDHRGGGGRPGGARPAVSGCRGERLGAARQHRAHVTGGAGDDTEQHQALHGQVVEAVAAAQVQRGFEFDAGPGPVVAFEQRGAPAQAGECLQGRFGRQFVDVRQHWNVDVPSPFEAANCSAIARRTTRSAVSWLGQYCRTCRRSARAADRSPASSWVRAELTASHGSDACGWRAQAGERAAQCTVVAGEDQWHGEAVQQLRQQCGVAAAGGVVQGVDRLILACPPVGGGGVQLGGPGGSLAVQVGDQVGA